MATKKTKREETFFEKERRLRSRKQDFKLTYKKNLFYLNTNRLIEYLNQPDVHVRAHACGSLEDGTDFIQITIEGFKAPSSGI